MPATAALLLSAKKLLMCLVLLRQRRPRQYFLHDALALAIHHLEAEQRRCGLIYAISRHIAVESPLARAEHIIKLHNVI